MENQYLTKSQVKVILDGAPKGSDKGRVVDALVAKGYKLEGFNDQPEVMVPVEEKKPLLNRITEGAADIIGAKNISQGFGQAVAAPRNAEMLDQAQTDATKIQGDLLAQIKNNKALGKDTSRLEKALVDVGGNIDTISNQTEEVLNPEQITNKQVAGDFLQIGAFAFPYGKAAGLVTKGASKVLAPAAAKTAGAVVSGLGGGYLADIGFSLQDNESGADIFKPGVATIIGGAIPGAGVGIKAIKGSKPSVDIIDSTLGRIIQGKTDDIPLAQKALTNIDTSAIKTREELSDKLAEGIAKNSEIVDQELAKDTGIYSLDDLAIKRKNNAGEEVSTDFVGESLKNLDELYASIGDDVSQSNINLLVDKAVNEGLSRKEVNDIARLYTEEFGAKAFGKTGDALTSVNAQKFANVRKGLKEVARAGLGGEEAKAADAITTAMYNTKRLIDTGVEGVNKLKQRVQERSLMQKLGRGAINMIDALSGGFIKSAVGAALPSNVGLKTLNWLDLENKLSKDLDILRKAEDITDDTALIKFLNNASKKFKFPGDEAVDVLSGKN